MATLSKVDDEETTFRVRLNYLAAAINIGKIVMSIVV